MSSSWHPTGSGGGSSATLAQVLTNGNSAGASTIAMNANKITGIANGTAGTDAAAFGQIPTALPMPLLFSSVLSGTAASIDTGAAGIAGGHNTLLVQMILQPSTTSGAVNVSVTVNGDTGAHYDQQDVHGASSTAAAAASAGNTNWAAAVHDAGGTSGYPGMLTLVIPGYAATTFNKVGMLTSSVLDATAGTNRSILLACGWRSTAAISQLTVTTTGGNFNVGSSMFIYGT